MSASVVKPRKIRNIKHLSAVLDPLCKLGKRPTCTILAHARRRLWGHNRISAMFVRTLAIWFAPRVSMAPLRGVRVPGAARGFPHNAPALHLVYSVFRHATARWRTNAGNIRKSPASGASGAATKTVETVPSKCPRKSATHCFIEKFSRWCDAQNVLDICASRPKMGTVVATHKTRLNLRKASQV